MKRSWLWSIAVAVILTVATDSATARKECRGKPCKKIAIAADRDGSVEVVNQHATRAIRIKILWGSAYGCGTSTIHELLPGRTQRFTTPYDGLAYCGEIKAKYKK